MKHLHVPNTLSLLLLLAMLCASESAPAEQKMIDLPLAEAVETALLQNLGLRLSREDVQQAAGVALEAEGAFDYQLTGDVGATGKNETPVTYVTATTENTAAWNAGIEKRFTPGTQMSLNWNNDNLDTDSDLYLYDPVYHSELVLGISQPLLKGFGSDVQLAELNAARTQLEASSFLVDSTAADLAAEVKQAYWELVYSHQNLAVLQLSLRLAEKLRDETETRINAGKLAQIDLYQPESEIAQREQDLIAGEQAIGQAEDNLKLLMNSEDWLTPLEPTDRPSTVPVQPDINEVYQGALDNRPDLQAATLQIKTSQYLLDKADNDRKPSLDLRGSLGLGSNAEDYSAALGDSLSDSDTRWLVGLRFSRPLDNSAAEGRYRQTLAVHKKNQTNLDQLKQEIRRSVRSTLRDVELALKAIEATSKTSTATEKRLEAEQIKFDAGRSTTLDVLIAQQDYARALSAENRSKIIYAQSLSELDRIQGKITIP